MKDLINRLMDVLGRENIDEITISQAREIVKDINEYLYSYFDDLGTTFALNEEIQYFSSFHKYWENNYKEILNVCIDDAKCEKVADKLNDIYLLTDGNAFSDMYDTVGLSDEQICRVRILTANQDFKGSRDFATLAEIYRSDPSIFDLQNIYEQPDNFLRELKLTQLSQGDKRLKYAKNIAKYLIDKEVREPFELYLKEQKNLETIRRELSSSNAGYGNKKTDMFLRDMVVLGVWKDPISFEKIDVASDINTIKVALRTGIISTAIPLVSSFLDIFSYQYEYIDEMNAKAWRRVWEIWKQKYPETTIMGPCLIDYFIYKIVGKQFCKETLYLFKCDDETHEFYWHSGRNKTCQICYNEGRRQKKAHAIKKIMPCSNDNGEIAIKETKVIKNNISGLGELRECPFKSICGLDENYIIKQPPQSISIYGRTGWKDAYTKVGSGGGGIMA